jgi:prevent-host-death family protein
MKIASVADMKARLSAYLKASEEGPVVVTRNGKPVAVLLGIEDEEELERLVLAYSKRFRSVLEAARQQIREGNGIPHEQFWQEVESETGG